MSSQAEIESRAELEQRLKEAEEALQELEKGLNSMERSTETEEQMKGNVTQLRSECHHAHTDAHAEAPRAIVIFGAVKSQSKKNAPSYQIIQNI